MRIGHGYDAHRLVKGRKLIIGGVTIPHITGLLGHSDADVLIHAIMDALLGAAALGDIGDMFPDKDIRFKDADSLLLLREVVSKLTQLGYHIVNIDSTIIAEAPKLKPFTDQMIQNIANICNITSNCVSVKATTEENMGFTGRKEGICAHSVCLIEENIII